MDGVRVLMSEASLPDQGAKPRQEQFDRAVHVVDDVEVHDDAGIDRPRPALARLRDLAPAFFTSEVILFSMA